MPNYDYIFHLIHKIDCINLQPNKDQAINKIMPSKLDAYLQQYRDGRTRNVKLPSIVQAPLIDKKKLVKKVNEISKKEQNSINLTYSRFKDIQKPVNLLASRSKRVNTEQSAKDYKRLNKIQQDIIMQIKDIDACLQSHRNQQKDKYKTSLFQGYIFLNQLNQFVIEKFHDCLKIQSQASNAIVQGFEVPKYMYGPDGQPDVVQANIIKKVSSINNKLLDKSIKAIKEYDTRKNNEYQRNYGKQWSHYKRANTQASNEEQEMEKYLINSKDQSKITFIKSFANKNQSKSTKLFESKLSSHSKYTFMNDLSFMKKTRETKISKNYSIKTEPSELQPEPKMTVNLTKKDVKMMLSKHKNIISIWIPPSSYPQFFGIFTYKIIKSQRSQTAINTTIYKCKINRYFFYKFGLNKKVFDAILEWITHESKYLIESLQITVQKSVYSKVFAKMGWVLKFWQSANKVKASYQRFSPQSLQFSKS